MEIYQVNGTTVNTTARYGFRYEEEGCAYSNDIYRGVIVKEIHTYLGRLI